jgi:hypothetical protein
MFVVGAFTTIWFLIGGCRDMGELFRKLKTVRRDAADDGTVIGHRLPTDKPTPAEPDTKPSVAPSSPAT